MNDKNNKYLYNKVLSKNIQTLENSNFMERIYNYSYVNVISPLKPIISSGICSRTKVHIYDIKWNNYQITYLNNIILDINDGLSINVNREEAKIKHAISKIIWNYIEHHNISFTDLLQKYYKIKSNKVILTTYFDKFNINKYNKTGLIMAFKEIESKVKELTRYSDDTYDDNKNKFNKKMKNI